MSGSAGRALVVQDSPIQAEHFKRLLEGRGYAVTIVANGSQALVAAREAPPAVIISDIALAEMDGHTLCRQIKSDEALKDIPVVLVATLSGPRDIVRALECGADSLIGRSHDEHDLLARLRYIEANRELRGTETMPIGVEIDIAGRRHFISAERRQILDLLISTNEEAVHLSEDLLAREAELERSSRVIQGLYRIAAGLNRATTEREVAELAIDRALELPGVQAGWISLRQGEAGFRLAAARGLPPALMAPGAMDGDCSCRRRLLSGQLEGTTNIIDCERLQRAHGDTGGLRFHAAIPLWIGDRTLGVINLAGPGPGYFGDEDLKVLYGVGNQVALALERVRLHEHLEDEVRKRTAALVEEAARRERAEETRVRLTAILEMTTDFVAMGHADGRVAYYNRAARRMLGIGEDEGLSGIRVLDTHPEWVRGLTLGEAVPAAIRDGIWSGETALLSRDGREIPVSQVIIAHKARDGTVEFLSTIARDITKRKRAEVALRASETRHRLLAEGSIQGILVQKDFIIQFANPAMAAIFGYERPEDLVGQDLRPLIAPHERARLEGYWAARVQGQPAPPRYEFQGVRRDGSLISIEALVSMISWGGEPAALATFVDLTERKRTEGTLRQSEKLAAMGELLAGVAHELNNPLTALIGHAMLLRREVGAGALATRAEKIVNSGERCSRIVRNFLALAREYPPERNVVMIDQIAQEAVELLAYPLRVDDIEVTLDLAEDVPALWADPHQLHQVLVNLATNAHHAMRATEPPRRLTLATRADPARTRVSLEVTDTGPGIPPEVQPRIFEPFFTTKRPGQGTGLGLSLSRAIVESHGGSIRVESQPGQGASFVIELPVEAPPATAREGAASETRGPVEAKVILVVDDEEEVASVLAEMLSVDGHRVEIAANGVVALEKLQQRTFDLILSDVRMPELDGPGLYREVERRHPGLARRFVFLTGDTLSPETREFLEPRGIPTVTKPFALPEVRLAVERALRGG